MSPLAFTVRPMRQLFTLRARAGRIALPADERGFTLVELITVMAILATIVTTLTGLFVSASRAEADLNGRFQAQEQGRQALDTLRRELHCASVASSLTNTGYTTTTRNGATYYPAIAATLPAGCSTGSPSATTYVAWCTRASGARYALYRVSSATSYSSCPSSGGVAWATQLTSPYAFSITGQSATGLAGVGIYLPVNAGQSTTGTYLVADDIVLRNSLRQ